MKKIVFIFLFAATLAGYTQDLPTEPANGFAFPLGSSFTIKLYPVDSVRFDYSVIDFEPFQEVIDTFENDHLFEEEVQEGTIKFYFCLSTRGDTEAEQDENMKVLLVMKNQSGYSLTYQSEIQLEEEGEFQETSNVGTYHGAKGIEMWPYMIYFIGLHDFQVYALPEH